MSELIEKLRYKYADYLHLAAADRIKELEDELQLAWNTCDVAETRARHLEAENERLLDALAKSCEEGREHLIQCPVATDRDCLKMENERLRAALEEIERCTDPDNGELMPWSYLQVNAATRAALQETHDD